MLESVTKVSGKPRYKKKRVTIKGKQRINNQQEVRISNQQEVRIPSKENFPAINAPNALRICTDQLTVERRPTGHDAVPPADQTLYRRSKNQVPAQLPQCGQAE